MRWTGYEIIVADGLAIMGWTGCVVVVDAGAVKEGVDGA